MTFNSIDEYEQYMEQINEEQYERTTMLAEQQEEFNKLMEEMDEEITIQSQIKKGKVIPGAINKTKLKWHTPSKNKEEKLYKQMRAVEGILTTSDFLGWLKGNEALSKLAGDMISANMYAERGQEFINRNQPS